MQSGLVVHAHITHAHTHPAIKRDMLSNPTVPTSVHSNAVANYYHTCNQQAHALENRSGDEYFSPSSLVMSGLLSVT